MSVLRLAGARRVDWFVTSVTYADLSEPDIASRLQLAYRPGPPQADPSYTCAAVLIPLMRFDGEWHVLFTVRTERVEHHKGQVSFPGGACDPADATPEATALRELEEEIGVRPGDVRVLGRLNEIRTITYFRITPVVGVLPWPYTFRISTVEVARVFSIPLEWLADPAHRITFSLNGRTLTVYFPHSGEVLWGASAQITLELLQALGLS